MAPIIPLSGVVAGLFRTLVSKQVTPQNYAKIKDLVNTLSRYIKDGKLRLTKTQNKAFNQQKNELTRFESRFRARTVPTKLKENVLPFRYKKSMKQEFKEMGKSDDAIKSRLEGMNKITRDRLNRRRFEKAVKTEKEKMSKDPDYIQDIIDPDDFKLASGGIAGQLHLNQGGVAWPAGRDRFLEEWNMTNAYKEMLDTRLSAMEASSTPPDQQDIDSISNYYNNLKEQGVDTTEFDIRIKNLFQPPKPSSGLSHILGV